MIWFAVRVLKALPSDDRYAPVSALAIAASVVGTKAGGTIAGFSRPVWMPRPEVIVNVAGAPAIWVTVSTLPTRSTTAIVAGAFRAVASWIACSTIVLTSFSVRLMLVLGGVPGSILLLWPPPP